jgi:hypothetical protein
MQGCAAAAAAAAAAVAAANTVTCLCSACLLCRGICVADDMSILTAGTSSRVHAVCHY